MQQKITLRFYKELNDFLAKDKRESAFNYDYKQAGSVKYIIESVGVPHTEVDLIIVNGESVDFHYQINCGDNISVYPANTSLDITPLIHCQPEPLEKSQFILDVHLGKLAAYLRMSGFDTLYRNDYDDPELAKISLESQRILLSYDRQLLMRKNITRAYFVRSRQPQQQLLEVISRFNLSHKLKPFTRCIQCNGCLQKVEKKTVKNRLLPRTLKYYEDFFECQSCHKVYWKGSHYEKMNQIIKQIQTAHLNT